MQSFLTGFLALAANNSSVDNYAGKEVYHDGLLLYLTAGRYKLTRQGMLWREKVT